MGSKYLKCTQFLSSAAVYEQLWSKADAMLPKRRKLQPPLMTEELLMLKENCQLWGIAEVRGALRRVKKNEKTDQTKKKMAAHQVEGNLFAGEARILGYSGDDIQGVDYGDGTY